MKKCKIAIVGAGMAGLAAAQTFLQSGITDIIVVEAKTTIGGRIQTIKVGSDVIDLGAQWLHSTDSCLYQIANAHNLISNQTADEGLGIYVRQDGYTYDEFLVKKVDFQVGKILEECEKFVNSNDYPTSVGCYLQSRFHDFLNHSNFDEETKVLYLELFDWHIRFQLIDNSCSDLNELSAKEWGRYSCTTENGQSHINIIGGYQALVNVLVEKIPTEVFLLNTAIDKINYCNKQIELSCEGDLKVIADYIIITISLGVLKHNTHLLTLSKDLSQYVTDMGFGEIGKVFLLFSNKWWTTDGFQLIWSKDAPSCETAAWTRHLSGFDLVLNQPNMLVGWVSGLGVQEMEGLSEEVVGRQSVNLLRSFLKDDNIPFPIHVYKTSWSSCKWTRGSYSHRTPACDHAGAAGTAILSRPVYIEHIPRILLAGEASHESHFSTTHGAYESGRQQALFLVNHTRNFKLGNA